MKWSILINIKTFHMLIYILQSEAQLSTAKLIKQKIHEAQTLQDKQKT